MNAESFLKQRLICITSLDQAEDAVPLAEALLAGGLHVMEITFRTAAAAESIQRIRQKVPQMAIGAGTLLTAEQVQSGGGRRRAIRRIAGLERIGSGGGEQKPDAVLPRRHDTNRS